MIKVKLLKTIQINGELKKAGEVVEVSNNVAHGLFERNEAQVYVDRQYSNRMMKSKTYQTKQDE